MLPTRILHAERLYFCNSRTRYKISSIFQIIIHKIAQLIQHHLFYYRHWKECFVTLRAL